MATIQELEAQIERLEKKLIFSYHHTTPIGAVLVFATPKAPMGWLVCNGQEYRIDEYEELYKTIGNAFNTTETPDGFFRVPNLQGQFIRGWDEEGNIDPEREFGTQQGDALQGHRHKINQISTQTEGGHTHKVYYTVYKVGSNVFENDKPVYEVSGWYDSSHSYGGDPGTNFSGNHSHIIPEHFADGIGDSIYNKVCVANETRPKNIALLYCIKAK